MPAPRQLDFGRHHDDVGRLRVVLGEGLVEHEQVVRRADGDQFAIRLGQAEAFAGHALDRLAVELFEMFVMLAAAMPFVAASR